MLQRVFPSELPLERFSWGRKVATLFCSWLVLASCASSLHLRGLEATAREEHGEAVRFYLEHLKNRPDDLRARNDLGVSYLRSGEYDLAFLEFQKVLAADPRYVRAYYNIGLVYNFKNLPDEEFNAYLQALEIDPGHLPTRLNLAHLYIERGEIAKAKEIYEEVLRNHPNQPRALYNLALLYDQDGKGKDAFALLERFLQQEPDPEWRQEAEEHLKRLRKAH
ncbi:MAG: tetratricopeptide repeat protein (plasmid) [Candidatus Manganitrophus sp.]|jgi:tetratricopeptide (TPR) repeat protein|nr:tetratricopeptide repeat protein [Candidatus Manganitrophus sp.]MDC4228185.1 tetratricopeptide repeat protein [Candidatus Manganitrophus sp.]WDT82863.1 MAG: tetratricopeptide repeat protein [Candidatus Manganitrophus sp.]